MKSNPTYRMIMLGIVLGSVAFASAQQKTWSAAVQYDLKHKRSAQYVVIPSNAHFDLGSLTAGLPDFPKFHADIDLAPIVGDGDNGSGTLGYQASITVPVTKDKRWNLVPFALGRIERHTPVLWSIGIGVSIVLN